MSSRACVKLLSWNVVFCIVLCFFSPWLLAEEVCAEEQAAGETITLVAHGKPGDQDRYWIGVWPREIDKQEARHLRVKDGTGVVIVQIVPGSPAAKSGLAKDDIILSVSGKGVSSIRELARAVRGSEGKTIQLKIQRAGKSQVIDITPTRFGQRSQQEMRETVEKIVEESQASKEKLEQMLRQVEARQKQMQERRTGAGAVGQVQRWQPLVVPMGAPLPDDMEVTIKKRGKQPAIVTVKQGQKMWRTTENELDMLPSAAQGYVTRMLGRPMALGVGGMPLPGAQQGTGPARIEVRIEEGGKPQIIQSPGDNRGTFKVLPGRNLRIETNQDKKHEKKHKNVRKEKKPLPAPKKE